MFVVHQHKGLLRTRFKIDGCSVGNHPTVCVDLLSILEFESQLCFIQGQSLNYPGGMLYHQLMLKKCLL